MKLSPKQRERLAGILATFAQVAFAALLVGNLFKEGNWIVRLIAIVMVVAFTIWATLTEPGENDV